MKTKSSPAKAAHASLRALRLARSRKTAVLESIHRASGARLVIQGKRVGTKRRDMRWQAPDGAIWASRFEYEVSTRLIQKGYNVRRTTESEVFNYTSSIRGGVCLDCKSDKVAQRREYTPDLFYSPSDNSLSGYYIEAKGYIRSERRTLLRAFVAARAVDVPLRLIVQRDYNVTANMTIVEWAQRYLKIPVHIWNGDLPEDWR